MPGQMIEAVKRQNKLEDHETAIQQAMQEFLATWDQPSPPSQDTLASKYGIPRLTLSAHI